MSNARWKAVLLSGIAIIAAPTMAMAQASSGGDAQAAEAREELASGNEIVVTARRRAETLQDVPQTVNALSSDVIQKLRINNVSDIAQVVPGLSIEGASSGASGGFGASSSIRGVPTFLVSNATPVVQFYVNDAPAGPGTDATSSLFDIGQIEVLKGPQGTLRGRSSPSGAITITTREPDLNEIGGFVNLSGTDRGNVNIQAAIGVPIIADVLALRVAGVIDNNDGDGVTSVNKGLDPYTRSNAVRGTLRFQPSPDFDASVMYQRLERKTRSFFQVIGSGNGINGPAIEADDRLGITDAPREGKNISNFVVGQFEWKFAGQRLTYIGSYRDGPTTSQSPQDQANVLPGVEYFQTTRSEGYETSHELRLSSDERVADIFDYTVGGFYDKTDSDSLVNGTAAFLSGAFGRPGRPPVRGAPNFRYSLANQITINGKNEELSFFGNVTAHIGEKTELSAGGRFIRFKRDERVVVNVGSGFNAVSVPLPSQALCGVAGLVASPVYTGSPTVCDFPIAASVNQDISNKTKDTPFVYNVSLSHRFTPDFMVYANVGSAFRTAGPSIGIQGQLECCQPQGPALGSIRDLVFHEPEKSTSFEAGFKANFMDRRGRLNVSVFHQKFDNYFFLTQSTRYLNVGPTNRANPAAGSVGSFEFTAGADAKVTGVDVEAGFQVTPHWIINAGFSWAKAKLDDALVPCNDGNFDGTPDAIVPTTAAFVNAGVLVARCRSDGSITRTPRWNTTLQSEFSAPVSEATEAFIRGNFVYYPENPNASQNYVVDNYALLNLYLGIRQPEGAWEVALFANNLFNAKNVLSVNPVQVTSSGAISNFFPGASNYQAISYTPRQEFGLAVRYAFGSR